MKKWLILGIVLTITIPVTLFFYPYPPLQPPKANDTGATQEGVEELVNANNRFAFEFYSELLKTGNKDENIFYSPYSIFSALAITFEGAGGQTAEEMKSTLHLPTNVTLLRPNFAAIYNNINAKTGNYELRTGNALWIQKDYPISEDYKKVVEEYYGGKAANVDFERETEKSRETINSFIAEQTNNKIKELIPKEALTSDTRLVITNAIYFKGVWQWQFNKSKTYEEDFKVAPNKTVKVQMMHMKPKDEVFNYTELDNLQILELPYKNGSVSMLILLPKTNIEEIEANLTYEKLKEYRSMLKETELSDIYLPRFEFSTKYNLNQILENLGMKTAFDPLTANFSKLTNAERLYISLVLHQAYINVSEEGTEAAGATAVIISKASKPSEIVFKVDHPFIFIIQERTTGNILFMGKLVDPTK